MAVGQFAFLKTKGRRIDDLIVKAPAAMKVAFGENPKVNYSGQGKSPSTRMAIARMLREELSPPPPPADLCYFSPHHMNTPIRNVFTCHGLDNSADYIHRPTPSLAEQKFRIHWNSILRQLQVQMAQEGTSILACAAGRVIDIYQDAEIGQAVTMDLGDGYHRVEKYTPPSMLNGISASPSSGRSRPSLSAK